MCTVTYVPSGNEVFLTSNRDENTQRKQAITPQVYHISNTTLVFPKDAHAGGTWIAMKDNGTAGVLLNGGFVKHVSRPPYKKSRGMVFLEILADHFPIDHFLNTGLENIEAFTLVLFQDGFLYECRWDGQEKYCIELDNQKKYIWSSVTLYDKAIVAKREEWFKRWIKKTSLPAQQDIFNFHLYGGDGDIHNDICMNREGIISTVSVTGISINKKQGLMEYLDLKDRFSVTKKIDFKTTKPVS